MDEIILQCENVSFKRKDFELKGINLEIRSGYITVITGENGAGKSTLLSILSGKNQKYSGSAALHGYELKECFGAASDRTMLERIGYISEEADFFMNCDAVENEMFLSPHFMNWDAKLYREKLKEWEVSAAIPLKSLSRGNYIRFQLAWGMAHHAAVYFMDEPTAGFDPVYKKVFYRQLQELVEAGAAVVLATNLYEDVEQIADYHIVMEDGEIIRAGEAESV